MMKKWTAAVLGLALMLSLTLTALAVDATLMKDVTLAGSDDSVSVYNVVAVDDELYIIGYHDGNMYLYRWQEGMAEAELAADDLFYAARFSTMEEAAAYIAETEEPVAGDPEYGVGQLVFTDGQRLLCLNTLNGKVFALSSKDGKAVYEDVCTVADMTLMMHVSPDYSYFMHPDSRTFAGGKLLMKFYDWNEETGEEDIRVVQLDVATGEVSRLPLEHVEGMTAYRDGKALLMLRDPENAYDAEKQEYRPYDLVIYDPATGAQESAGQLAAGYGQAFVYSPVHDALIYTRETRIMGVTGLSTIEQYGYAPVSWSDELNILGDSLVFRGNGQVYVRTLTKGFDTDAQVTIYGSYMNDGARLFAEKHPQVPVYMYEDYYSSAEEISQAMLTGDDAMDVLELPSSYSEFFRLMDKGYCADLSADAELMAYAERLYPAFRDAVMKDGKLYAIPIEAYSYDGWFVNRTVMEDLGLTKEDLPTNLVELCELANRWNDEWVEEFPSYTLISYVEDYRREIFSTMLNGYVRYYTVRGEEVRFDTPVFRQLMAAVESLQVDELNRGANLANEDETNYRAGLFMTGYPTVGNFSDPDMDTGNSFLQPMTLTADMEYTVAADLQVMFINPRTQNMEAALNLLKCNVEAMSEHNAHVLLSDETEPVPNEYYEDWVKSAEKYLAELKKDMA